MALSIRIARTTDAATYAAYMAAIAAEDLDTLIPRHALPDAEQVRSYILSHDGTESALFLAEEDGHLVGTLDLTRHVRPRIDHVAGLGLSVVRGRRGAGIGRALLAHAIDWAAGRPGLGRLELEVLSNNSSAIHLYESAGFQREGTRFNAVLTPTGMVHVHGYAFQLCPPSLQSREGGTLRSATPAADLQITPMEQTGPEAIPCSAT